MSIARLRTFLYLTECDSEREPHAKAFMSASGSPKSRKKILNGVRASVILSDNYWKLDGSEVN